MHKSRRARLVAYVVAVLATGATLLVRWPLWPVLGDRVLFMAFFPAVLIAAHVGGFGPGLLATALSVLGATYFLVAPLYSLEITLVPDAVAMVLFVLTGLVISGLSESRYRSRRRIVAVERRAEESLRESEERFRQLAEHIREIFWITDPEGDRVIYASPGYEEIWGRTLQSLHERPGSWADSLHPDDRDEAIEHNARHPGAESWVSEYRVVRPDGSVRWVRGRVFLLKGRDGHLTGIAGLAEDITERKQADEALRESEQRYRTSVDNATDAFFLFGEPPGRILDVNRQACESLGYSRDELVGMTPLDFDADVTPAVLEDRVRKVDAGETIAFETRFRRRDGTIFPVEVRSQAFWEGGRRFAVSLARDITERKRAEDALRASERRFRTFVDHATDGFFLQDDRFVVLDVNRQACESLGYSRDELVGMTPLDFDPGVTPGLLEEAGRRLDDGEVIVIEGRHRRKDGSVFPVEIRARPFREGGRRLAVALARDITERKQAEEALQASERRFRILVDNATDAFFLFSERRILDVNRQACESLGYSRDELVGMTPLDFDADITPADLDDLDRKFKPGETITFESRHRRRDGTVFPVEVRGQSFWEGGQLFGLSLARDITERKQAEEALRESEHRFRTFVDNATDAFFLFGEQFRILDVNRQACESLGCTRGELVGMTPLDFDPDVTPAMLEEFGRRLDNGEVIVFESRHRRKDGTVFPVEVRGQSFREGDRRFFVALARDITERKQAEEALRASEQRFRTLTESLPHIVWTAGPDGVLDYVNARITEYTGLTPEQTMRWGWKPAIHPEELPRFLEVWTRSITTGEPYENEFRLRRAHGAYHWHLSRALPLRDDSGRITRWVGFAIDLDDQKRAEETLRASERRFRTLAEALPTLVWTQEPDGTVEYVNTRTIEYTGLSLERLRDWDQGSTIHPEDLPRVLERWARSLATGELCDFEYRLRRADGTYRWNLSRSIAVRDDSGRIIKWVGFGMDIDDQKRAAEELRQAREAAEAANRAKDEFLATVSHEIRTPMNAIIGMTELVLDTPLTDDQRQCLRTVKSAAHDLLGLLNDLLDFSRIEAGKLELNPADFSLRAAAGDTLRALAVRAHQKGLELIYDVQPEVPDALVGDAGRLRQVLLNLVSNAIKFTDEGEVVVRAELAGDPALEGEVTLRFTVRDTGIGIPRDQQERIFRAFEQEDASTTRKYGGTGLGLTIAARLVVLMGGQIAVESEPGRGSTFSFTARFGRQPHPAEDVPVRPLASLRNLPVLVVDDNATNRRVLEEWLRNWQMVPAVVGDGLAALSELWHAVGLGRPYTLALLDARMPDTDGLALAAQIRQRAELSATRIILLTSGDRPGDLARSREVRIDAHLLKPVQQDELLEAIYRVMSRADGNAPTAAAPPGGREPAAAPVAPPLRILVAEDNEVNAQLLERLLTRRGHRVRLATDGREALALAKVGAFDLLLLDVQMPEMDGLQVIRAIRERERSTGGHLPVIALTARARQEDRERCLAAGMDDFLAKPIQAAELWSATERVTGPRPPADRPGPGLLDPRALLAACGGDAATLEEVCQVLRARLPDHLTAVQDALQEGDAIRLREAAHKLCGTVAAFSTAVGAVASDLEDQAARGQLEEARPLLGQLEAMAQELLQMVAGLSIEALRQQAGPADDAKRAASP